MALKYKITKNKSIFFNFLSWQRLKYNFRCIFSRSLEQYAPLNLKNRK